MALEFKPVEVVLESLDQKTSKVARTPGKLEHAINVEYDKTGAINKRLGYQFVDLQNTVNLFDDDAVFCNLGVLNDELVVFSYDYTCALASKDSQVRGADALVYRGPSNRGAVKLFHVSTSATSTSDDDDFLGQVEGRTFAGHEHGDVAAMQCSDGPFYRCFVYLNRADWRIDAVCYVEQPHGQMSVVFENAIRVLSASERDNGVILDSPKIIAVGDTFVVHWIESDGTIDGGGRRNLDLYRATTDMTAFDASLDGWDARGSVALYNFGLYDVCNVLGSDTDFVIARQDVVDNIRVERFEDFDWIDTVWQSDIERTLAPRVLAVYAHDADNDVVVSYQPDGDDGDELWSAHLDADDGGSFAEVQTFTTFPAAQFVAVGHARVDTNGVAVIVEACQNSLLTTAGNDEDLLSYALMRSVVFRQISSADASRVGTEHWCHHLHMVSRPWVYNNGTTSSGTPKLYCTLSYKSCALPQELPPEVLDAMEDEEAAQARAAPRQGFWRESRIFVASFEIHLWETQSVGATVKPRIVGVCSSVGVPDGRPTGQSDGIGSGQWIGAPDEGLAPLKRMNHLTHASAAPPFGPDIKTRTMAVGIFASLHPSRTADGTAVYEAQNAGISGLRFYMEDPWTIFRDETDPAQPVDNFVGCYPRSMFQNVQVGNGLAIFGGAPYLYDGRKTVELGFHVSAEIVAIEPLTAQADWPNQLENNATYSWYVVPTWPDAAGQTHRGPPSNIVTATLGASDHVVQLRVRTIPFSLKDDTAYYPLTPKINFELYRTKASGSVFYKVYGGPMGETIGGDPAFPILATPVNDATLFAIDIFDGCSDANLILQGLAPFTLGPGGFIEVTPQPVPALQAPCVWQNRLWGADQIDPTVIWYSSEILPEFNSDYYRAPEFNGVNTFRIDGVGEVVALQPYGNDLIVFTRSATYAITGEGNDDTGEGANFTLQLIDAGTGCIEPRSVVLAPTGVFFQSHKGYYYLAGRQLDYLQAGASIEDDIREAGNVRGACMKENSTQLLVACNGRPVTTYTTTWEVSQAPEFPGSTYSITLTGVGAPGLICTTENALDDTDTDIATRLVDQISTMLADRPTGLHLYIASVSVNGDDVRVVWQPDVVPSYTDLPDGPGNSLVGTDTSSLAVQPRVLALDYLQKRWSRWEMIDVSSTERLNEVVGSATWRGAEGFQCHAVLHQGGLRIQRSPRDENAYADQTSVGADVAVRLDIKTAPIHFAGIGGWQRLRRLYIQATKHNASQFNVDLDYFTSGNYEVPDDIDEDITVDTTTPAGLEVCPRRQKLQAIAIRIHEPVGVTDLQNVTIHSITLLAGLKRGIARHGDAQRGVA